MGPGAREVPRPRDSAEISPRFFSPGTQKPGLSPPWRAFQEPPSTTPPKVTLLHPLWEGEKRACVPALAPLTHLWGTGAGPTLHSLAYAPP